MFIEQPAIYLRWLYPRAYWRMDRRVKAVYLTFDDGPIPEATPFILDTLKEFGVRATFFMVGDNVRKYPELYKRILAEGHQVGNHTHNHIGGLRHTVKEYSYNGVEFYSAGSRLTISSSPWATTNVLGGVAATVVAEIVLKTSKGNSFLIICFPIPKITLRLLICYQTGVRCINRARISR